MRDTRVLFVNHTSTISGAEMVLLDTVQSCERPAAFLFEDGPLVPRLQSRGVRVIHSRFGSRLGKIKRDTRLASSLPLAGRMSAIVAELSMLARRHDVIYANSQKAFIIGSAAAAIARRPLIWHLHDIIAPQHFGAGQRRIQIKFANRFTRAVVAPSIAVKSAFVAEGGREDLVEIVPNGLDVMPEATLKQDLRRELGLPSGPLAGVFSRLAPWKGQHVVLRALAQLPGVSCAFAGAPLFGEEEYAESLHKLAANLKISDRVLFLGQRSDVPRLMRAVDAVIHPSVDPEPFGRTLVEAMLVRTPVIATDAGAASEILAGGKAGLLVPPGDENALAEAVRTALRRSPEIEARIESAESRARSIYSAAPMRAAIAQVIDRVAREARQ
jgi:glycosyltransferase involved in cell wall biosynthesis